jgi:hypothetical protein
MIPQRRFPLRSRNLRQRGYALLLVVFLTTMLLLLAVAVAPNIRTEGQREKEKEMVWRGRQYIRGVKLYYRKMGRFPTSIDDLTKPQMGSLRFMRQAYKDPMNEKDGSWRLIYVGPAGNLIGSLKPQQPNLQFGLPTGMGTPVSTLAGPNAPGVTGIGNILGQLGHQIQAGTQPGAQPGTAPGTNSNPSNPLGVTGAPVSADQGTGAGTDSGDMPVPTGDTPTIVGGNIIGVGSKINKKSIMVYEKAKNYRLFEFIWDPSKDIIGIGQPGIQTGTGMGQVPGQMPGQMPAQTPSGQQPGQNPNNPPQTPQQPPQNPPQNPQQ